MSTVRDVTVQTAQDCWGDRQASTRTRARAEESSNQPNGEKKEVMKNNSIVVAQQQAGNCGGYSNYGMNPVAQLVITEWILLPNLLVASMVGMPPAMAM